MSATYLCDASELADKEAKEFTVALNGAEQSIFLVKHQGDIKAYQNACPHTGGPLNWQGDVFLDVWKKHIQCSLHGALFDIQTGACLYGPCQGDALQTIQILIEDQKVLLPT